MVLLKQTLRLIGVEALIEKYHEDFKALELINVEYLIRRYENRVFYTGEEVNGIRKKNATQKTNGQRRDETSKELRTEQVCLSERVLYQQEKCYEKIGVSDYTTVGICSKLKKQVK